MADTLPYVIQPGSISKILEKIKEAKTPDRFTVDFLQTKLGFRGGNYRQFIPFAKKLTLLSSDGSPTDLYKKYRNASTSRAALAEGMKAAYRELFDRNEYANSLTKDQLKGLVVEITGLEPKNRVVQLVCQSFEILKNLADFEQALPKEEELEEEEEAPEEPENEHRERANVGLNLAYTINLVLPKTDDPSVFNAIFKSLRENLLRK